MTGTALELIKPAPGLVLGADEQQWNQMIREARVLASTAMVPRAMQGKPEVVLAAMCVCEAYGADRRLAINQVHYMNNELVPSAQLRIGIAITRGYEVSWSEKLGAHLSSARATIAIRKPGRRWETFTFTHDDAVKAGKFDEWAELWPQGGKKQTWIVRRDGQPYEHDTATPKWVTDAVEAGHLKRFDGWWNYEEDMLASAVARKAIRRYAPDALLGIDSLAVSPTGDIETGEIDPDDDEPEIVPDSPRGDGAVEREGVPASAPPAPASQLERQLLHSLIDGLTDAQKTPVRRWAKDDGIPHIDGPAFTDIFAERLAELIERAQADKTDAEARGSADAEEVGGAGVEPQATSAPTCTKDEEPSE